MAKILLAGALDLTLPEAQSLAKHLGEEVIDQGHILLGGCRNEFDRVVAESAHAAARAKAVDPDTQIISYAVAGALPVHSYGKVLRSRLATWGLEFKRLQVPEPVHDADAVIIVGGQDGTLCAANWTRIAKKPLLPITAFGGAAATAYHEEIKEFATKYADRVEKLQYEALNQVPVDLQRVAREAVSLAARIQSSKRVFVIRAFSTDPKLLDAYESFKEICEEYQYECGQVDNSTAAGRIVPEILDGIRRSAFVVADLSEHKPNVYYELGLAHGLDKLHIVTALSGTTLPFDVHDVPTIFWENQKQLKEMLRKRIGEIATLHGRGPRRLT